MWRSVGVDPFYLDLSNSTYNAHNDFLQVWADTGLIGLLFHLLAVGFCVMRSLRSSAYLLLSFVVLFSLCSLSESLLLVQKGIMLFSLFTPILLLRHEPKTE